MRQSLYPQMLQQDTLPSSTRSYASATSTPFLRSAYGRAYKKESTMTWQSKRYNTKTAYKTNC